EEAPLHGQHQNQFSQLLDGVRRVCDAPKFCQKLLGIHQASSLAIWCANAAASSLFRRFSVSSIWPSSVLYLSSNTSGSWLSSSGALGFFRSRLYIGQYSRSPTALASR